MVTLQLVLTLFGAEQHLLEPNQLPLYRLESNLRQGQQPVPSEKVRQISHGRSPKKDETHYIRRFRFGNNRHEVPHNM